MVRLQTINHTVLLNEDCPHQTRAILVIYCG